MTLYPLGTAIRWASLMPSGLCPPVRPDLHAFLGYRDEQVLALDRPMVPGHFVDGVRAALVQAGYVPRSTYTRFLGSYDASGPIVLSPRTSLPIKDWPQASWLELHRLLLSDGYQCEWETLGSLWELEAQLRGASLVVGGDSGPLHMADHMGIPVLGLYGATRPAFHGPQGIHAQTLYDPRGCARIPVSAVLHQIRHKIPRGP